MQYSLLSRFEGCLFGLGFGEQVGLETQAMTVPHPSQSDPRDAGPELHGQMEWTPMVLNIIQALVRSPMIPLSEITQACLIPNATHTIPEDSARQDMEMATLAIATLPIALYYHDDLTRQRQSIAQVLERFRIGAVEQAWLELFAYAIAHALKGQLDPQIFLSQLRAYYHTVLAGERVATDIVQGQLHALEQSQTDGILLGRLLQTWATQPLPLAAIALLCFLQTPDHLELTVRRSWGVGQRVLPTMSAIAALGGLTGAIAGAHTSVAGISPACRVAPPMLAASSPHIISNLAMALFASWSGYYDPTAIAVPPVVTAPWVLRPRLRL